MALSGQEKEDFRKRAETSESDVLEDINCACSAIPTPLYMVYLYTDTGEAVVCGDEVGKCFAIKNYTRTMEAFKIHAQVAGSTNTMS